MLVTFAGACKMTRPPTRAALLGFRRRRVALAVPDRGEDADDYDNPKKLRSPAEVHCALLLSRRSCIVYSVDYGADHDDGRDTPEYFGA